MKAISRRFAQLVTPVVLVLAFCVIEAPMAAGAPPQITVWPEPPAGWVEDGEYPITATATSDRTIQRFRWELKGVEQRTWSLFCGLGGGTRVDLCEIPGSITYVLRPAALPDGIHTLSFSAMQVGAPVGNWSEFEETVRSYEIRIDSHAPAAPQGLALIGGGGWRAQNEFAVRWTRSAPDGGTPVVGASYRVCPATNAVDDASGCVTGTRPGSDLDSIHGIAVPGTGVWRLQVALEDAMGHVNLEAGATIDNLRLDVDAPTLAFLPRDPGDPARVQLAVADEGSGVASVAIEARRQGETTWRTLSVATSGGRLTALLDDDTLPAGKYEVRGHAIDGVGNERSLTLDGSDRIQLPVRSGSRLVAGAFKRRGRKLDARPSVGFGKSIRIHGRVTDQFGEGRAGVAVEVSERLALPGVAWRPLSTVTTDEDGNFTFTAPKGVARTLRFQHAGSPTARAAADEVALRVRAKSTLKTSRRNLRNGDSVVLRGRLLGRPIPSTGKLVTLQAWTRRGWVTFATARARAKTGKWSYRYTFTSTTMTARYRFRAVITQEESYPYVTGVSPVRAVVVRGARQ